MKIKVKYFGVLVEKIGCKEEFLIIEQEDLRSFFNIKYPEIKQIDYKIAVNHQLLGSRTEIKKIFEVALLPPFAGG